MPRISAYIKYIHQVTYRALFQIPPCPGWLTCSASLARCTSSSFSVILEIWGDRSERCHKWSKLQATHSSLQLQNAANAQVLKLQKTIVCSHLCTARRAAVVVVCAKLGCAPQYQAGGCAPGFRTGCCDGQMSCQTAVKMLKAVTVVCVMNRLKTAW